ncbi:MAG: hypothetical protein WC867_08515 [Candidatus Pacearchaeota archaeon]|jgi:hypothetical protein
MKEIDIFGYEIIERKNGKITYKTSLGDICSQPIKQYEDFIEKCKKNIPLNKEMKKKIDEKIVNEKEDLIKKGINLERFRKEQYKMVDEIMYPTIESINKNIQKENKKRQKNRIIFNK